MYLLLYYATIKLIKITVLIGGYYFVNFKVMVYTHFVIKITIEKTKKILM